MTAREFQGLADVPAEAEWFANIDNRQTRRAYQNGIKDFMTRPDASPWNSRKAGPL